MQLTLLDLFCRPGHERQQPPEPCLHCGELVDTRNQHIFVRDADESLDDDQAEVGLLHLACENHYAQQTLQEITHR